MLLLTIIVLLFLLLLLIGVVKLHPFLSFILVALIAGWWLGIPPQTLVNSVKNGIGQLMGDLLLTIGLGAMLGKLIAESGAAQQIANSLIQLFGKQKLQWAMMITGFIVGIPLFYNVGFILLVPLVFSLTHTTKLPIIYIAIPMLAALSVTHGFLPPHPSPVAITAQLNAETGKVLFYGLLIAIPTVIIAGPLFAQTIKNVKATPLSIFVQPIIEPSSLPGKWISFICALMPVLLISFFSLLQYNIKNPADYPSLTFWGDSSIVLLVSLLFSFFSLGIARKISVKTIMQYFTDAIQDISPILLIIAGAGALKQVLIDSGISKELGMAFNHLDMNPLMLGWLIAATIRVCIGSATVAALTAAGIIAPLLHTVAFDANLMVLAIGAGSLMFSHINDSGFWMFKSYFNLTVKETLKTWSLMETIVSIVGLIGVLLLNQFFI